MATSKSKKITISLSSTYYESILLQAEYLDLSVNTLLKQLSLSAFNKANVSFLTKEQKLLFQEFTRNQFKIIDTLNKIKQIAINGDNVPTQQIIDIFREYHSDLHNLLVGLENK